MNRMVTIAAYSNPEDSATCVVRLLLVYVLRTGAFKASSMDEIIGVIRTDPNKTLPWAHPTRSLIYKLSSQGSSLVLDEPAGVRLMLSNVTFAADKAGRLENVKTDDNLTCFSPVLKCHDLCLSVLESSL